MTDEQMRVKVAEACGWRKVEVSGPLKSLVGWIPDTDNFGYIPDYPNDLNACHEMEKVLTREQQDDYSHHISQLVPQNYNCGPIDDGGPDLMIHTEFDIAHATARQRCEAFLRTIGQWEEQ